LQGILEFAKGPLFRLSFGLMILGLIRILVLDIWGAIEAYNKAGDKNIPLVDALKKTLSWLFPVKRAFTKRPFYSVSSILFHIGLIITPIFLFAHIKLWESSLGINWPALSKSCADWLTLSTIFFGLALFIGRISSTISRFLSRKQDYFWPLLLVIPFISGYICANFMISPQAYQIFMLVHILSAELIFVIMPFTKIAHCVLIPMSQLLLTLGWKFPANLDEKMASTLIKKEIPVESDIN
jgi:nitrate reductase gamma subunit